MVRVYASLFAALSVGLTAQADQGGTAILAPTIAETEEAKPDWYQQFTIPDRTDLAPDWQTQTEDRLELQWLKGEQWSLSINLTTRYDDSVLPREEMQAGAEFQLTPRITLGGEVSIGAEELDDTTAWENQDMQTGIRLRSAFKF